MKRIASCQERGFSGQVVLDWSFTNEVRHLTKASCLCKMVLTCPNEKVENLLFLHPENDLLIKILVQL